MARAASGFLLLRAPFLVCQIPSARPPACQTCSAGVLSCTWLLSPLRSFLGQGGRRQAVHACELLGFYKLRQQCAESGRARLRPANVQTPGLPSTETRRRFYAEAMKSRSRRSGKGSVRKQELEKVLRGVLSAHASGALFPQGQEPLLDLSEDSVKYVTDEMWEAGVLQPLCKEQLPGEESSVLAGTSLQLHQSVGQLLEDLSFATDAEQAAKICRETVTQWRALHRPEPADSAAGEAPEESDEEEEDTPPGCCELCKRFMPLTFHHLVPKSTHKLVVKRKLFSKDEVNSRGINICRPCHSAIHRLIDHKQMAYEYNSLDKLLEHEGVQKWIAWAEKQRTVAKDHAIKGLRYHR